MFYVDCFVFVEFDFHAIEFNRVYDDETFLLFDHDVDRFDDFIFFDREIIIDEDQNVIDLKFNYSKRFDAMK